MQVRSPTFNSTRISFSLQHFRITTFLGTSILLEPLLREASNAASTNLLHDRIEQISRTTHAVSNDFDILLTIDIIKSETSPEKEIQDDFFDQSTNIFFLLNFTSTIK